MSQLIMVVAEDILLATRNPFVSYLLVIDDCIDPKQLHCTASIVAVVAAGISSLEQAVPMVMVANIGYYPDLYAGFTLLHYGSEAISSEPSQLDSADIFNIFTVLILLPLEISFRFLVKNGNVHCPPSCSG